MFFLCLVSLFTFLMVSILFYMTCKSFYVFTLCCVLCHCGFVLIIMLFFSSCVTVYVSNVCVSCVIVVFCRCLCLLFQCCLVLIIKLFLWSSVSGFNVLVCRLYCVDYYVVVCWCFNCLCPIPWLSCVDNNTFFLPLAVFIMSWCPVVR